jgi:hypothetical protein
VFLFAFAFGRRFGIIRITRILPFITIHIVKTLRSAFFFGFGFLFVYGFSRRPCPYRGKRYRFSGRPFRFRFTARGRTLPGGGFAVIPAFGRAGFRPRCLGYLRGGIHRQGTSIGLKPLHPYPDLIPQTDCFSRRYGKFHKMTRIRVETPVYDYYNTAARLQVGNPNPGSRRQTDMGRGKRGRYRRKPTRHTFLNLGCTKKQGNGQQQQAEQVLFHGIIPAARRFLPLLNRAAALCRLLRKL